jgi:hypothetical protein
MVMSFLRKTGTYFIFLSAIPGIALASPCSSVNPEIARVYDRLDARSKLLSRSVKRTETTLQEIKPLRARASKAMLASTMLGGLGVGAGIAAGAGASVASSIFFPGVLPTVVTGIGSLFTDDMHTWRSYQATQLATAFEKDYEINVEKFKKDRQAEDARITALSVKAERGSNFLGHQELDRLERMFDKENHRLTSYQEELLYVNGRLSMLQQTCDIAALGQRDQRQLTTRNSPRDGSSTVVISTPQSAATSAR